MKKIMIILLFTILLASCKKDEKVEVPKIYNCNLYSESNTYNYLYSSVDDTTNYNNNGRYDFSKKNDNEVSSSTNITILTHGMSGSAANWSNDGKHDIFSFTSESLITRLYNDNTSFYWGCFSDSTNFEFYDITSQLDDCINNHKAYEFEKTKIVDEIDDNCVLIYEASEDVFQLQTDKIYTQFNYLVSSLVKMYKDKNDILPKINLIGHSQGGLVNLLYTLDHPDLVDKVYSLGTPYLGSTSASIDANSLDHLFGTKLGGEDSIIDSSIYLKYLDRWNSLYDTLYKNIDVYAISGYTTLELLNKAISSFASGLSLFQDIFERLENDIRTYGVENAINKLINSMSSNVLLGGMLKQNDLNAIKNMFVNEVYFDENNVYWRNDGLVDLASALGYLGTYSNYTDSYKGFTRIEICYTVDNCNLGKTSKNNIPVVHNLESRDNTIINNILSTITGE